MTGNSHSYRATATAAAASLNLGTASSSERTFPPQTGFSYSGWLSVEVLPAVPSYLSSIGLLTLEKQWENTNREKLNMCTILQIHLDLQLQSIIVSMDAMMRIPILCITKGC